MREFLRVVLKRYRGAAVLCALLTGLCGLLASMAVPNRYNSEALVLVVEPTVVHWLANPFAPVPSSRRELAEVPELLRSRDRLVALVKGTALIDQWDAGRPWPLRLKDRLVAAVLGPPDEKDRLEALVAMVDRQLYIEVEGRNKVHISAEWSSPEIALALVQNTIEALMRMRAEREGKTLELAARALDRQREGVKAEMEERVQSLESARRAGTRPVEGEREQLRRDQSRAADLLVLAEEKHITAEIFQRSNSLRFTLLRPPLRAREPIGAGLVEQLLVGALASLLAGLVCAALLGLVSGKLFSRGEVERGLGLEVLGTLRREQTDVWGLPNRAGLALAVFLAVATGAAVGFTHGQPVLSLLPPLAFVGARLVWTRPLKWPLFVLMQLAIILDDPSDRAYVNLWKSPFWSLGRLYFANSALFTGAEICILVLTFVMFARGLWFTRDEAAKLDPLQGQVPRPLKVALLVSAGFVGWLVLMGVARGGVFREALWQFRTLLMMCPLSLLLIYSLEIPKDLPRLLGVLITGSMIKSLLGIYFMYFIAYPQAVYPPHTTGHNDTMILVTSVVSALTLIWERPTRKHLLLFLLWMPFVALALKLNDRRVAYMDIVLGLGLIYVLSPWHPMKRKLTRAVMTMMPVLVLYTGAGWNSHSSVFGPVQKLRSIIAPVEGSDEEGSNVERDIENFNLVKSWQQNMFVGQGFGHAFTEYLPSNDFGQSNFGHIGHNSILWLLWIGGVFGFTGVLAYLAVGVYFLGRALARSTEWRERVALLVSVSIILTYLVQAYGDMGTQSIMFDFFVGTALAIAGRLATKSNSWLRPRAVVVPQGPEPTSV